jgi:hypothetical protein
VARPRTLSTRELNRALLARQGLLARKRVSIPKMIEQVGGLQTQEPRDAFISLWSRISNFNPEKLREAAERREIVRGSYMRCTLHTVSAEDFRKFRLTLSPVIERDAANWRPHYVGLDIPTVRKAVEEILSDDEPRSGREIGKQLHKQFPELDLDGLVNCARIHVPVVMTPADARWHYSRPPKLMLAERWLGGELSNEQASELMLRGLAAIGPASTSDLRTWSGMPGVRETIEPLRPQLKVFRDEAGREMFDLPEAPRPRPDTPAPVRFLGEFDNTLLSHADRERIVDAEDAKRFNLAKNGRRELTVLIDGRVRASWRLTRTKQEARIVVSPFRKESKPTIDEVSAEAERLLRFLEADAAEFVVDIRQAARTS